MSLQYQEATASQGLQDRILGVIESCQKLIHTTLHRHIKYCDLQVPEMEEKYENQGDMEDAILQCPELVEVCVQSSITRESFDIPALINIHSTTLALFLL